MHRYHFFFLNKYLHLCAFKYWVQFTGVWWNCQHAIPRAHFCPIREFSMCCLLFQQVCTSWWSLESFEEYSLQSAVLLSSLLIIIYYYSNVSKLLILLVFSLLLSSADERLMSCCPKVVTGAVLEYYNYYLFAGLRPFHYMENKLFTSLIEMQSLCPINLHINLVLDVWISRTPTISLY